MLLMHLLERLQSFFRVMEIKLGHHRILLYIASMVIVATHYFIKVARMTMGLSWR
jgi:hypothetical protein